MTCLLLASGESSERAAQAPRPKHYLLEGLGPIAHAHNRASTCPSPAMAAFAQAHGPEGFIQG